jgi:hypothetical protein
MISIWIRKSFTPPDTSSNSSGITEQYNNTEEIVPTKGQAQSLKNRFAEFEKDALKVETSSAKIKHTPKRFVVCIYSSNQTTIKTKTPMHSFRTHLHLNKSVLNQLLTQPNVLYVIKLSMRWKRYDKSIMIGFNRIIFSDRSRQENLSQIMF